MKPQFVILVLGAMLIAAAGCSRDKEVRCEDPALYSASTTVARVRVPDDLSVPDESQSLLIPDAPPASTAPGTPGRCLEAPARYFEETNSGQ